MVLNTQTYPVTFTVRKINEFPVRLPSRLVLPSCLWLHGLNSSNWNILTIFTIIYLYLSVHSAIVDSLQYTPEVVQFDIRDIRQHCPRWRLLECRGSRYTTANYWNKINAACWHNAQKKLKKWGVVKTTSCKRLKIIFHRMCYCRY